MQVSELIEKLSQFDGDDTVEAIIETVSGDNEEVADGDTAEVSGASYDGALNSVVIQVRVITED